MRVVAWNGGIASLRPRIIRLDALLLRPSSLFFLLRLLALMKQLTRQNQKPKTSIKTKPGPGR
jgi:hypothetical protein